MWCNAQSSIGTHIGGLVIHIFFIGGGVEGRIKASTNTFNPFIYIINLPNTHICISKSFSIANLVLKSYMLTIQKSKSSFTLKDI